MRKIFLILVLVSHAIAATTTLTGTIKASNGSPLNGTLTMRLPVPAQDTATGTAIAPTTVTFQLVNGVITGGAPLYDVLGLQPQNLYYIARAYDQTGALQFYGYYNVTGATYNLGAATPTTVTTSNVSYANVPLLNLANVFTGANQICRSNGVATVGPSCNAVWGTGDIGSQITAAIASLPSSCGEIYIPAGSYSQSTSVVIPRCVKLHGASALSTLLTWTGGSGWQFIVADGTGGGVNYPHGAIEDISMIGPGSGVQSGGVYVGGTDGLTASGVIPASPSSGIDPASNFGDHFNFNRVHIFGFGVGIQWGHNSWSDTFFEGYIDNNTTAVNFPTGISAGSGERLDFVDSAIQNNSGNAFQIGNSVDTDIEIANCSFDFNVGFAIQNGTSGAAGINTVVNVVDSHFETLHQQIQNFGQMSVVNSQFLGGGSVNASYLIDNEGNMFLYGNAIHNAGTGGTTILNAAQSGTTMALGNTSTSPLTPTTTFIDNSGIGSFSQGLNALAFIDLTANPAQSGAVRLASGHSLSWRNNANGADIALAKNASDQLTYNSLLVPQTIGTGTATSAGTIINTGTSQTLAVTVTGATTTDVATCATNAAYPATWQTGIQVLPPVVTSNTVTLTFSNPTAGNITPAAQTFRCTVVR